MQRKTSRTAVLKTLLLLPLAALALAAFAQTRYVAAEPEAGVVSDESGNEQLYLPFGNTFRVVGHYVERVVPTTGQTTLINGVLELNPADGQKFVHTGVDVIPDNDTIRAPYSGSVSGMSFGQTTGLRLVISHNNGLETTWGHLASFLVSPGSTVKGGQPIAIVGNTGKAVVKHLHLETRVDGELKDPLETLFGVKTGASGRAVDGGGRISLNLSYAK